MLEAEAESDVEKTSNFVIQYHQWRIECDVNYEYEYIECDVFIEKKIHRIVNWV